MKNLEEYWEENPEEKQFYESLTTGEKMMYLGTIQDSLEFQKFMLRKANRELKEAFIEALKEIGSKIASSIKRVFGGRR